MSDSAQKAAEIVDDAWQSVVGGMDWLKSVLIGEFADNRPLSAVVADMLVSFVPGVVIVTSARDAIAVTLRLAQHPEKREELMEWVLLCACLITIALPLAMAAGGAVAAGVGAVVGGIAGSELGAALRAVMLMLVKQAQKLVDLVRFLQKFIKGDILKFLRAVKFAKYEKPLLDALGKITGKLIELVRSLRLHLESLRYFESVKQAIAKLADWERKFYAVQQDALKQIPKALVELDARLAKVLAQTAPREIHTASSGVKVERTAAALPPKQEVADAIGQSVRKLEQTPAAPKPAAPASNPPKPVSPSGSGKAPKKTPVPPNDKPPLKDKPDSVKTAEEGKNTKRQETIDPLVQAEREHVSALSRAGKIEEARQYLKERVLDNPAIAAKDKPQALIDRLDVSSAKDKAVFWSGDLPAAKSFAEEIGGVTLESTTGGKVVDRWDELGTAFPGWEGSPPPNGHDFWSGLSRKYAEGTSGTVNVVQSAEKAAQGGGGIWKGTEGPVLSTLQDKGVVDDIIFHVVGK